MIGLQNFHIHTGTIVVTIHKTFGDDLHQIRISDIIFRQQHQMIITVFSFDLLPVKTGARCHIHLTATDRIHPRFLRCTVKIDHTIHHTMIRDRPGCHPQFPDPVDILCNLIGTVQQTVLCMDM